jgi:hypothetical protein
VDRKQEDCTLQPVRLKLDPGSKTTGVALVRESQKVDTNTGEVQRGDGYGYAIAPLKKGGARTGAACAAALSLPGLQAGVSREIR